MPRAFYLSKRRFCGTPIAVSIVYSLFISQLMLAQMQSDCFLSLIEIYKALGGGWDLEIIKDEC